MYSLNTKHKSKTVPVHVMKTNRRSICTAPPFLNLRARGIEQSITHPCGFANRKKPWYSSNRRLHGPQSWSRHSGEKINILALPGFNPWTIQPQPRHYTDYTTLVPQLTFYN